MKRTVYGIAFTVLGLLIGFLLSGLSQLIDPAKFLAILLVIFGFWGLYSGKYWWHQIYELKIYRKWRW